jgi:hypothetical protein
MDDEIDSNNNGVRTLNREEYLRQKKKETLDKLDNAKFSCFHVRACVVSGIGLFTVVNYHTISRFITV